MSLYSAFWLAQTPNAPTSAYAFYQIVKGRKMCFDGCGAASDYIYFDAFEFSNETLAGVPNFTLYTEGESLTGFWQYESTGPNSADVTLNFDSGVDICTMALWFDTKTSGSLTMTCRTAGVETGTWEILDRP